MQADKKLYNKASLLRIPALSNTEKKKKYSIRMCDYYIPIDLSIKLKLKRVNCISQTRNEFSVLKIKFSFQIKEMWTEAKLIKFKNFKTFHKMSSYINVLKLT